jgi:hypothetical protein
MASGNVALHALTIVGDENALSLLQVAQDVLI